ncbi:MAG: hypothetical protein NT032_02565 [Actinobacteria bacterium]|nr:hypothetical protein [Actinomycetota bacterium]
MKASSLVDELIDIVEAAKNMPLSQSCMINRSEVLGLLDEIQEALPREFSQAASLLNERDGVLQDAAAEGQRIIEIAKAESRALVTEQAIYKEALKSAEILTQENEMEILKKRRELDDYIDAKLAAFEAALVKTLNAVQAGRERTAIRLQSDLLHDSETQDPGNFFGDWQDPRP